MEAVISHLVVKNFQIPCAHAPAVLPPQLNMAVCPKSAAEEVSDCPVNLIIFKLTPFVLFNFICFPLKTGYLCGIDRT